LFVDANGASFAAITGTNTWRFSVKASGPATPTASTGLTNITVALDGAGDFATLQGASDWVPQNNTLKRTITILPGTYRDFAIFTQNRNKVTVIGTGATRDEVEINYPNAAFTSGSSCGLLRVESTDMYFRNFTLDNEVYLTNALDNYGPWAGRLNTLVTTSSRLIFDNVMIKGGQDTLYAKGGIAYYNHCEIWGSTDFIYGQALAVFDQCNIVEIKEGGGPITAPSTPYAAPYGLVFTGCNFPRALKANGYPYDVGTASTTFMRPWGQDGLTAIINCALGSQITTKGWSEWGGREATCRAREAGSTLIGGGSVTPASRQSAGAYWLDTSDPDYTPGSGDLPTDTNIASPTGTGNRVAVTVNTNDYTVSAIFGNAYYNLGGWLPTTIPTITANPTSKTVAAGSSASFSVAAFGQPAPAYQWRRNGTNIASATSATLNFASTVLGDSGVYSVVVSNSAGVLVSSNATLTVPAQLVSMSPAVTNGMLTLSWPLGQTGYRLQCQTNPPGTGLSTNWQTVANSVATNRLTIPINLINGSVFYRLIYP
jgi:pectinesterase